MSKGRLLALIAVIVVIGGFAGMALYGLKTDPRELPSALIGKEFPEFELENLLQPGNTLTRADLLGKPALVNVWATWCPTCRQEHEDLNNLARQGIPIFGVNYRDEAPAARKWLRDLRNPYRFNISDPQGKLGFELGVYGAPETFLIDKHGIIRLKHVGEVTPQVWQEKLEPVYQELLAQ